MSSFLANENVPRMAIEAAREAGYGVAAIRELEPGADDQAVLSRALSEGRVLVTFDKDFGEMTFGLGASASKGIILLRPRLSSPQSMTQLLLSALATDKDWEGHFSVAREGQLRMVPLS